MNEQDIADLLGIFAKSLTPDEHKEFQYFNGEAYTDHCINLHPSVYEVCDDPRCKAGFEIEILSDLYYQLYPFVRCNVCHEPCEPTIVAGVCDPCARQHGADIVAKSGD